MVRVGEALQEGEEGRQVVGVASAVVVEALGVAEDVGVEGEDTNCFRYSLFHFFCRCTCLFHQFLLFAHVVVSRLLGAAATNGLLEP